MTPLATLIGAWAAVYGYVCTYYAMLYWQRREDRQYFTFSLLSGGLCVYALGQSLLTQATEPEEALLAVKISAIGVTAIVPFFVDFCHEVIGEKGPVRALSYVWATFGLILAATTDTIVDTHVFRQTPDFGLQSAPHYLEPQYTTFGKVYLLGTWLWTAYALALLVPVARHDRDVRTIMAASLINVAAAIHDVLLRSGFFRSYYLLEHTALLAVLAMSYVLMDRFFRTRDELTVRKRELDAHHLELRQAQARLVRREQLAAVGELSAVIAHEVRNPLAVLKNAASGLRRKGLGSADQDTLLEIMNEETSRLNRLMHDLLAYARPVLPGDQPVDVMTVIAQATERAKIAQRAENLEVRYTEATDEESILVPGDADLLRHAFSNIVENAILAMPTGGALEISVQRVAFDDGPGLQISFIDSGEGFGTQVQGKARDPFFTTRSTGTGLGLAIVERVVHNHAGALRIGNAEDFRSDSVSAAPVNADSPPICNGACVRITLPLDRRSVPPLATRKHPGITTTSAEPTP